VCLDVLDVLLAKSKARIGAMSFGMVGTINVTVPVDLQSFKID
jgi:hypothetical protein